MSFRPDGEFRYDGAWRRVRELVLARDGGECRIRGEGCTLVATCVDHVVPWRAGGALYDPENLRGACVTCNTARSNMPRGGRRPSREW